MDLRTRDITALLAQGVKHALTLWPEWIAGFTLLDKRVENRDWAPPRGLVGTRIALHAGAHIGGRKGKPATEDGMEGFIGTAIQAGWQEVAADCGYCWAELSKGGKTVRIDAATIVTGAIVCTGVLRSVTAPSPCRDDDPWYTGGFGWRFDDVEVLPTPIPCKGSQKIWQIGDLL